MTTKINKTNLSIDHYLRTEDNPHTLTLEIDGEQTTWNYNDLSFYEKQKCISKATVISQVEGEYTYNFDLAIYYTEALSRMLVAAPIPITTTTLQNLKASIGDRLISIVPAPLEGGSTEAIKKD